MALVPGKQAFLEILKQEGVSVMFGNPGTTELPLMDGLARAPELRYVLALHEGVAISMADGYAQASGGLGAVNVHVSPGLGNAMGMLYDAMKSNAPLLLTAGQHDQSFTSTEPILWSDLPPVARPFVKWSTEVRRLPDLPRVVHRAAKTALAHPTGPVFLSLPVDVLNAEMDLDLTAPSRVARRIRGDAGAVDAAARILARAERPLLIVGDQVAYGDAVAELVELAETLGAVVMTECFAGRCNFPFRHPLHGGPLPRLAPLVRGVLMRHDVMLAVCAPIFTLSLPSEVEAVPPDLTMLHLDVDPWEIAKNYPVAVGIHGEPKATLPDLTEALRRHAGGMRHPDASRRVEAARAAHEQARADLSRRARAEMAQAPMTPTTLMHQVAESLPVEGVLVDESISSGATLRHFLRGEDARSFFGPRGGGIGWGIPAALGVKLAVPDRPVVALIGDGSAMYSIQGLWTAVHDHIDVVFVIVNNLSYRILKQRTYALKGFSAADDTYVGMDLDRPRIDFLSVARGLGVAGERVEAAADVPAALQRGLKSGGSYLIDVRVDGTFR
jgi:benzoylformate decarboxylase